MQLEMRTRNFVRLAGAILLLFVGSRASYAQNPNPAANTSTGQNNQGLYPGWNLGVRFEGSTDSDGSVYDLGTGVGYNFSHHFGVDLGVPYYFVGTPSSVKGKNPGALSGSGIGNVGADLKWNFPGHVLNYDSTIHLGAPTGDTKKGFSTGHATWNWANHIEHGWGNFTPFIDAGAGNTLADTKYFHRPYMTFGYNAQFEAGTEVDAGPISLSASAYDVAPWGNQAVYSRVFRCTSSVKCGATGTTTDRKGYLSSSVTSGGASLVRDNGFNASAEFKPLKTIDLEVDYSRSVPLQLNTFSFGISLDVGAVLRRGSLTK
jgi:hypothetical protein